MAVGDPAIERTDVTRLKKMEPADLVSYCASLRIPSSVEKDESNTVIDDEETINLTKSPGTEESTILLDVEADMELLNSIRIPCADIVNSQEVPGEANHTEPIPTVILPRIDTHSNIIDKISNDLIGTDAARITSMQYLQPIQSRTFKEETDTVIKSLHRELSMVQSELCLEAFLRQQHVSHLGRLFSEKLTYKQSECLQTNLVRILFRRGLNYSK